MTLLFVTHETSRTGAPKMLLYFLQWLQVHKPELIVDLVALKGGDMEGMFQDAVRRYDNLGDISKTKKLSSLQKLGLKLGLYKPKDPNEILKKRLLETNYDVVYANTVASIPFATNLAKQSSNMTCIAHVHEMSTVIQQLLPDFTDYVVHIDQFIVPSEMAKDNLSANWGVSGALVKVIYECSDVRMDLAIKKTVNSAFVVGASGTVHWRKGYDVFIQLARYVSNHWPELDIRFEWVGAISKLNALIVEEDLRKLGLEDKVYFIGEIDHPETHYKNFDVFVMPSREDPFPLVCIEVGMLGKPIISFEQASGSNEIIKKGGGFVVPYLNVEAMAEKIVFYHHDREAIALHGAKNEKEFGNFTVSQISNELYECIKQSQY